MLCKAVTMNTKRPWVCNELMDILRSPSFLPLQNEIAVLSYQIMFNLYLPKHPSPAQVELPWPAVIVRYNSILPQTR
jgi:hypothetical protein